MGICSLVPCLHVESEQIKYLINDSTTIDNIENNPTEGYNCCDLMPLYQFEIVEHTPPKQKIITFKDHNNLTIARLSAACNILVDNTKIIVDWLPENASLKKKVKQSLSELGCYLK